MATNVLMMTPDVYFKSGVSLNEDNINNFRDHYRRLSKINSFDGNDIDERSLLTAAQQLSIQADADEHKRILRESVQYEDLEQTYLCIDILVRGCVQPISMSLHPNVSRPTVQSQSESITEQTKEDNIPKELSEIECIIITKRRGREIEKFLHTYLLQVIKKTNTNNPSCASVSSLSDGKPFLLHSGSLLALFMQELIRSQGTIRQRQTNRLRLVEPFTITDEFSTWPYDHFRGLFEMEVRPYHQKSFPNCWILGKDVHIYCRFIFIGSQQASNSVTFDRPRTGSLEQFVEDVCSIHDMEAKKWIEALHAEDIFSFAHLSNLKQTEWDNIKRLSMNAKRILKEAVDRERETVADDRRRWFEESTPNEDHSESSENSSKDSRSELLANLHLIKLFIHHTLRFERALQSYGALPKLEAACIDASFAEMGEEGFADDGLFPPMAEFFLPLTISEQELKKTRPSAINRTRKDQLDNLIKEVHRLETSSSEAAKYRKTINIKISDLNQTIDQAYISYIAERSEVNTRLTARQQAEELQQMDRQWQYNRQQFEKQMHEYRTNLDQCISRIIDYDKQIDELNTQINNIETELSQPQRPVDKGLVKPARGFIMYGPPGTGKSEIMKKLSTKLGICMVGPALAAGELNRPLVGESERVIIALASRCHRVPYAMCCLSIDEIDSLAPKRDEDSSEGKVDKISVLLSLIDGIKDIPNLMIFCATNRLHMMDEAFLRRMSGKFFVGRPSSQARTKILAQIPSWALEPDLIDQLAIASTNFSGAACKAFTRAVTVHCMAMQRTKPNYHVNYREALKIADRTAQQYQIFLGSETLPRLLLRDFRNGSKNRRNRLKRRLFAGRIIVDLHGGSVRIEIIETTGQIGVIEHKLQPNETSVQSLLERLTNYGKDRNVQLIQLIDLNLLASQGAYDEKKVFETLKERYDECVAYTRSMIIYDLDALVGVNKSESDSSMGRSMSSSVVNQNVYTYVRARFREAVVEQEETNDEEQHQTVEKWAVAVIREPFLSRQFAADVQFARTRYEEEELEIERRKAEDLLKCVKCKDFYIENENKMGNCVHHDGFIYDNSAPDLTIYSPSQIAYTLTQLECDMINYPDRREKYETQKNKFKWICCDATVTTSTSAGGCKKGKHRCGQPIEKGQQQRDSHLLDQHMIRQWEEECRRNQEYNEKWLLLLENRS